MNSQKLVTSFSILGCLLFSLSSFADTNVNVRGVISPSLNILFTAQTTARNEFITCKTTQGDPLDGIEWIEKTISQQTQGTQGSRSYNLSDVLQTGGFCDYQPDQFTLDVMLNGIPRAWFIASVADIAPATGINLRQIAELQCLSYRDNENVTQLTCTARTKDGASFENNTNNYYVLSSDLVVPFDINVSLSPSN